MKKSIDISVEQISANLVYNLLLDLDPQFAKRLSESVVLEDYAKKLSEHAFFISAKSNNEYLGICAYYVNEIKREYFIPYLCVSPSCRNMGIAARIFDTLCKDADTNNYCVSLEVRNDNLGAIKLYQKFDFKETLVGHDKTYMTRERNSNYFSKM